jgi:hypothetical protein
MLIYARPDDSLHTVDYQPQRVDPLLACHASTTISHPHVCRRAHDGLRLKFWKNVRKKKLQPKLCGQFIWQKKFDNKI